MNYPPNPGEWFTWGSRVYWYRFVDEEGDVWIVDRVARHDDGDPFEPRMERIEPPSRSKYLAVPADSPNLPDHIRVTFKSEAVKGWVDQMWTEQAQPLQWRWVR